ncbi:hypothetical protein HZA75_03155 [Candidatus Roizmanbacteria bacterium]|nr:hypothetical protein [Candidatus Roizmanbacteria bacterium]
MPEFTPPKDPKEQFNLAINRGITLALTTIENRFEQSEGPNAKNKLYFHTTPHTKGVISRTGRLLRAIHDSHPELVSERDILLGKFIAAWHDVVQNWEPEMRENPQRHIRKRKTGENETKSAQEAISYMDRINNDPNGTIFTEEDKSVVKKAINLTIPHFDIEKGTVAQENFENYEIIAQAVGLADLGVPGMELPQNSLFDAWAIIKEEELDITNYIELRKTGLPKNIKKEEEYALIIKARLVNQLNFVKARKDQTDIEIQQIANFNARNILLDLFNSFDATINATEQLVQRSEDMNFEELISAMESALSEPPVYSIN